MQPRLRACDIELEWAVDLIDPIPWLDAQAMRQLQFMVFEALSNVMQHAHARCVRIEAEVEGNLHWPQEVDGYTPAPDASTGLWFARDVGALATALDAQPDLLTRQLLLLDWLFARFARVLPRARILRYEDVFARGQGARG